MASYIQSITFGGGGVDLKGQKGSPEFFIGANFAKDKKIYATAKEAGGLDTRNENGMFRLLYDCQIKCIQKLAIPKATDIVFTIYESDDNDTFVAGAKYTTKIEKLNKARRTPLSFPLYSSAARYLVLGISFAGGSVGASDSITAGLITATVQPSSY